MTLNIAEHIHLSKLNVRMLERWAGITSESGFGTTVGCRYLVPSAKLPRSTPLQASMQPCQALGLLNAFMCCQKAA